MRPRNTLILLLVLAALGAYVYWVEIPEEARKAEQKKLLTFDRDAATGVTLAYPDQTLVLEKNAEGRWRLVQPIEADADEATVKNVVGAIADAEVTRSLEDVGDKLASYGLAPPEATITLRLKDGTALPPIKVGKTTQVGFAAYVQKGDDPKVHITTAAFQSGMKKQVKDLRDKTVIAFEDTEVQKIELARPSGTLVLERQGEGAERWDITAPARYPADSAEVRALLASARGIRADDFVSEDPSADLGTYGLAKPRLRFSVWLGKDQAQKTLLIGGDKTEDPQKKMIYAKRAERPTIYTIPEYSLKNIDKELTTLRDKTVAAFDKEKATKIVVTRKDGAGFTLAKKDGAWHLETPGEGAERGPTITRFIEDIVGLKGSEILAEHSPVLSPYGLEAPDVSITVTDDSGATLAGLIAARGTGAGAEATAYVAPSGGAIVYGIKPFVYDRLDKKALDLREPPATPVPSGAVLPTPAGAPDDLDEEQLGGEDFGDDAEDLGDEGAGGAAEP